EEPINNTPSPQVICSINNSYLPNINWHHTTGILATLRFDTSGTYYENNADDGQWSITNNCDSIFITRPSNSFYYHINSITADTLVLENPVFGYVTFYAE